MHVDIWLLWSLAMFIWISDARRKDSCDLGMPLLRIGVVLPQNSFWRRKFQSAITYPLLNEVIFTGQYKILTDNYCMIRSGSEIWKQMVVKLYMEAPEDPATVQDYICHELLDKKVNILFMIRHDDNRGITTPTTSFIMNFANSIGLPVIAWIGDNSGLAQTSADSTVIQMTPSVTHQCRAMFALLKRYSWFAFTIVTSQLAGQDHFINTLRDMVDLPENKGFELLSVIRITSVDNDTLHHQLNSIEATESRVILLYASSNEALKIFRVAEEKGMTEMGYIWIVSRTVVQGSWTLPAGLLGVDFETNPDNEPIDEMSHILGLCVKMWSKSMKTVLEEAQRDNRTVSLIPNLSCNSTRLDVWHTGRELYRKMINLSMEYNDGEDILEFNADGTMKHTSLAIMNLQPVPDTDKKRWKKIGRWTTAEGLNIEAIFWPGDTPLPPEGRPPKYRVKVVTLEEVPYVIYSDPDPNTGLCSSQSYECKVGKINETKKYKNATHDNRRLQCCSGFCLDLLNYLAEDIGFDFELFEVEDKIWGAINKDTGEWEGLVKTLMDKEADMAMTSLKITPERNSAVDFSIPFLETGITIIVAVRDGVITPTAFLKPFDEQCWVFILLICIQVMAVAVFIFEWMSPNSFNLQKQPPREHKFSLFRSFWLIWAMLFGAAVNVDNPRGVSSRFLANIWALFAVVFTASYTANLATFMITNDDHDKLSGIDDPKIQRPFTMAPPYKFGTIPNGSTDVNLKNNFPNVSRYMYERRFNYEDATKGVNAVKMGELNAFIYDATVLEYKASHDNNCTLKTVGRWYAMTGYGVAFPKNSRWLSRINRVLRKLQYRGTLDRLSQFWLAGTCQYQSKDKESHSKSIPLGILNFTSAFILLAIGILLGVLLLLCEHVYFKFFRVKLRKLDNCGFSRLISLNLGQSLTFEETVLETMELQRHYKCRNPVCKSHTHNLERDLKAALSKLKTIKKHMRGVSLDGDFNVHDVNCHASQTRVSSRTKHSIAESPSCTHQLQLVSHTTPIPSTAFIKTENHNPDRPLTPPSAWQNQPLIPDNPDFHLALKPSRVKRHHQSSVCLRQMASIEVGDGRKMSKSLPASPERKLRRNLNRTVGGSGSSIVEIVTVV